MIQTVISSLRSPHFVFLSCGVIFALLWHISILYFSPFAWLDNRLQVEALFLIYLASHTLLILLVCVLSDIRKSTIHWSFILLLVFGYCIYLLVRALNWNVLYYYGGHIDALFWDNAFYKSGAGMLITRIGLLSIFVTVTVAAIMTTLINRMIRHQTAFVQSGKSLRTYMLIYCALAPLLLLILGTTAIRTLFPDGSGNDLYTRYPPEYHVALSVHDFLIQDDVKAVVLSERQKTKLASMGLLLETTSTEYPLMKSSVYLDKSHELEKHPVQPNVILVLVESLSSYFVEETSMLELEITPNLNDFAGESLSFSNIINANTPTLQGQIATLASSLHVFKTTMAMSKRGGHTDVFEQNTDRTAPVATSYPFLSLLLKQHGYESIHIQSGDAGFADTERYFRFAAEYDDFVSLSDRRFADQRQYNNDHWGAADIDTFRQASRWLENRQQNPFMMSISTIDIHHPYIPVVKKQGVDNDLLNTVFSTDTGFGLFWDYFKNSKYKDNTILIVTADHALFPTAEYMSVRGEIGYYDRIPLMIYSPFHPSVMGTRDPVAGSQLDIAPTVFELLGLDSSNAFLGLSLLSDRKDYPYRIGRVNLTSRNQSASDISWSNKEQTELIGYIRYLASQNRLYPSTGKQIALSSAGKADVE